MSAVTIFEDIRSFFEQQSALANFLQIGGVVIAIVFSSWRWIRRALINIRFNRLCSVSQWVAGKQCQIPSEKSLRVAIVDDEPEGYPLDSLRRLGYTVVHIASLGLAEIPSLLSYQCILLDINGVLVEDPKRGGLEILKRLKRAGGSYVVAVSSKGFDITMSEFFMLADHRLKKPIPQAEFEGIIKGAFETRFSAEHAARRVDLAMSLSASLSRTSRKAFKNVIQFVEGKINETEVSKSLLSTVPNERVQNILSDLKIIKSALTVESK